MEIVREKSGQGDSGFDNPATMEVLSNLCNQSDIGSRGMKASELEKNNLWWFGPEWLTQYVSEWPKQEKRKCTKKLKKRAMSISQ